jgi:hypothetical protein
MNKLAYIIRIITVAPIMALVMLLVLFICAPLVFGGTVHFILTVLFLTVFPLLAYPLQPLIKKYRDKGREGQRTLAMIFAVAGYILGFLFAVFLNAPKGVLTVYFSYMLSGLLVAVANKLVRYKASGHACGVAGPFILLVYFGQAVGYLGIPVLGLVFLASLYMKRHTLGQLLVGTAIPFAALGIILIVRSLF